MSYHICLCLTVGVYILAIIGSTIHTGFMLRFLFCKNKVINHSFCDLFPLLELSCSSIFINELLVLVLSAFNILTPDSTILTSYIFILSRTPNPLPWGQVQSLQHMQLSHLSCCCFLWICSIHVPEAIICEFHGSRESVLCVLYMHHSHAKSSNLQSAE